MKVLLIPSAILVAKDMRRKYGDLPAVLYPLNGTTMLEHICRKYIGIVDKIVVVGYEKSELLDDYIKWKKLSVELVVADKLGDLGCTIYFGIRHILKEQPETLYINFGDTLVEDTCIRELKEYVGYSVQRKSVEWTFFEEEQGKIVNIVDKQYDENCDEQGKIFVGAFSLSNIYFFEELLGQAIEFKTRNIDSFYVALEKYSRSVSVKCICVEKWFDVGHIENYYKAKTGVETRAFNIIDIDEERGILKKKSNNVQKFVGEINWYIKIPKKLQYLLPRVYDYSVDRMNAYIEMEYYGYPTLHELFLWGELPLVKWQEIFRKLLFVINDMEKYAVQEERKTFKQALTDIYVSKTILRLNELRDDINFKDFFTNNIVINGNVYECLEYYIEKFKCVAQKVLIENYTGKFTIIHGDFCFANILVEENYKFIRLIDPRGEFGGYDIYGDSRYELAKLLHSIEGKYDYIIGDMFEIKREGMNLEFDIPEKSESIFKVFMEIFKEKLQGKLKQVRLIEASLFLSMIPLHSDNVKRQYAMLVTGLMILKDVLEEMDE